MGIKTIYTDDIDDSELGPDAKPVRFALEGKEYLIYLSGAHKAELLDVLDKFIKNAQSGSVPTGSTSSKNDKGHVAKVRAWAIAEKIKFRSADGTMKPVGDKGRLHADVWKAYDEAHPDD